MLTCKFSLHQHIHSGYFISHPAYFSMSVCMFSGHQHISMFRQWTWAYIFSSCRHTTTVNHHVKVNQCQCMLSSQRHSENTKAFCISELCQHTSAYTFSVCHHTSVYYVSIRFNMSVYVCSLNHCTSTYMFSIYQFMSMYYVNVCKHIHVVHVYIHQCIHLAYISVHQCTWAYYVNIRQRICSS